MISVLVGAVFVILGGAGIAFWFSDFLMVIRGFGPVSLFLGGLVALLTGFSSLRPRRRSNEEEK